MEVRPATPEDATDIARVHVKAWQEAYAHLLPAQVLENLDVDARAVRWRAIVQDEATTVWVGGDDQIEGWASVSAGRDVDRPRDLELEGIYVLASSHGSGLGQLLLNAALGDQPAYLWVAADNPRANRFYRRNGFLPDGPPASKVLAGHPIEVMRLVR